MPRHVIRAEDLPASQEMYAAGATSYQYHCYIDAQTGR
jgi:hypothetical protein